MHRFWIEAEAIDVFTDEKIKGKKGVARIGLDNLKMVLKKHRMVRDINGELKDTSNDEEGWPIYVLSPHQLQELEQRNRSIEGHAMLFNVQIAIRGFKITSLCEAKKTHAFYLKNYFKNNLSKC
ncbi:MAG: hypothetical protein H0U70_01905 [Tatlockia sp.]|nr:hypothetical protein [Tatlockia sp.]